MVLAGLAVVEAGVPPVSTVARRRIVTGKERVVPAEPLILMFCKRTVLEGEAAMQKRSVVEAAGARPMKSSSSEA